MKKTNVHPILIRLTHKMWVALRRLQEVGKINSLQAAAVEGLEKLIQEKKGGK